jgi:metacaspase-1
MLTDGAATSDAVIQEIGSAALRLSAGDVCLITYSGHGGQVPDSNGDEFDGQDETWVLFDRMLIDDELYQLWSQFDAGVRIVVVSDSCHSGTVLRLRPDPRWAALYASPFDTYRSGPPRPGTKSGPDGLRPKVIPQVVQQAHYQANAAMYRTRQMAAAKGKRAAVSASAILLSGCQDNQLSADGATNGLFTENLLAVWGNGQFSGGYQAFLDQIAARMPPAQTPNLDTAGESDPSFPDARPFSLGRSVVGSTNGSPAGGTHTGTNGPPAGPSIVTGPDQAARSGGPPALTVSPAPNTHYAVELATDPTLFDRANNGARRTADNFYGSWEDTPRLTGSSYTIPPAVWDRLKAADRSYYRAITTAGPTGWTNYIKSSEDNAASPPSILVTATPVGGGNDGPPPSRGGGKQYPRRSLVVQS